uniref:DUF608 domain-containing protein n=1 Tax=Echinostoma caproni TaxID=27848 RepID=A0A183ARD7_9TREM
LHRTAELMIGKLSFIPFFSNLFQFFYLIFKFSIRSFVLLLNGIILAQSDCIFTVLQNTCFFSSNCSFIRLESFVFKRIPAVTPYPLPVLFLFLSLLIFSGHEYRMYNTIDVHCYASWALIKLWPKIELAINYDCADLTVAEDRSMTYFIHQGQSGVRSARCAVPHDFGDPENDPWRHPNAYIMYQTDHWKDLNTKFIIESWRDWKLTRDYQYLLYLIPIVCVSSSTDFIFDTFATFLFSLCSWEYCQIQFFCIDQFIRPLLLQLFALINAFPIAQFTLSSLSFTLLPHR